MTKHSNNLQVYDGHARIEARYVPSSLTGQKNKRNHLTPESRKRAQSLGRTNRMD
jgi:hypothetical protein